MIVWQELMMSRRTPRFRWFPALAAAVLLAWVLAPAGAWAQNGAPDPSVAPTPDGGIDLIEGTPAGESGRAIKVYIFGDALARGTARGLRLAFRGDKAVKLVDKAKVSSGFVRDDFYDWNAKLEEILENEEMDIAIVMVGSNDRQRLRRHAGGHKFGEPEFRRIYAERVDRFMQQLRRRGILVYWLGLPNMRGKSYSAAMSELNEIYKERAEANGVTFVPTWDEFSDAVGAFSLYGEDISGTVRRLRSNDGVHFTRRGYRKLASLVERQIRDFLAAGPVGKGERVMVGADGAEATDTQSAETVAAAGGAPQDLGANRLTATSREDLKASFQAKSPAYKVLTLGEAIDPKPGRGDDFSWSE